MASESASWAVYFPVLTLGRYQGVLGACVGLGNTIGPFMAAGFIRHFTWRVSFYFIAPLAVCIALLLVLLLPRSNMMQEPVGRVLGKIDWLGILLSSAGTIVLLVPVSGFDTDFLPTSAVFISMVTIGAVLLVGFVVNEWRFASIPMLPRK